MICRRMRYLVKRNGAHLGCYEVQKFIPGSVSGNLRDEQFSNTLFFVAMGRLDRSRRGTTPNKTTTRCPLRGGMGTTRFRGAVNSVGWARVAQFLSIRNSRFFGHRAPSSSSHAAFSSQRPNLVPSYNIHNRVDGPNTFHQLVFQG